MRTPSETAAALRRIASRIDSVPRPSASGAVAGLRNVLAAGPATLMDAVNAGEGWIEAALAKGAGETDPQVSFAVQPVDPPDLWRLEVSYADGQGPEYVEFDAALDVPWGVFAAGILNRFVGGGTVDPELRRPGSSEAFDPDDPDWTGFDPDPGVPEPSAVSSPSGP